MKDKRDAARKAAEAVWSDCCDRDCFAQILEEVRSGAIEEAWLKSAKHNIISDWAKIIREKISGSDHVVEDVK